MVWYPCDGEALTVIPAVSEKLRRESRAPGKIANQTLKARKNLDLKPCEGYDPVPR